MSKKNIGFIVLGVIVLGIVFYGGMIYGKSQVPARGTSSQFFGQNGGGARGGRNGGGFTSGQIIAKDASSITIQLLTPGAPGQNGEGTQTGSGSKIILLGNNTKITKLVDGTAADLSVGADVSVVGVTNADGSVNAQTIQIRPNIVPPVVK